MKRIFYIMLVLALFPVRAFAVDRGVADFPVVTPAADDYWVFLDTSTSSRYSKVLTSNIRAAIGIGTTSNVVFGNINASGGTLSSGVANTTQGALVLYTNTDPIYSAGLLPAATPSAIVSVKFPPAMPTADNSLWNVDINGTGGWTDPATFLTPSGVGGALTVTATGFDGNLATTDNTVQEIAQKFDDFVASGGGYTNLTEFVGQTAWRVFYSDGSGDVKELALGADGTYLKSNGASAAPTFATPAGSGDMVLATAQSVTGAKTFDASMLLMKATSTNTGVTTIANANSSATNYTLTLPAKTGTIATLEELPSITIDKTVPLITGDYNVVGSTVALIGDTDGDGKANKLDMAAGLVKTDADGVVSIASPSSDYNAYDADLTTWAGVTPGTGVATFLATPSSSNLRAAVTDESGTGVLLFAGGDIGSATSTGAVDFGAGTSFEIPNGNDVNVDAVGEASYDTNGNWLRAYDGTNQIALAQKQVCHDATVAKPNDLPDAHRDAVRIWQNNSGMSFIVTSWSAQSSADNTDVNIETTTNSGGTNATVDAVSITTDGTSMYYASDSTITAGTISNGSILWLDFDDTDTPDWAAISVCGYYNGDVD